MKKQWWQEEVVYQIYPKSFKDSNNDGIGDLKGITEKLDYLKDLGVTMLWICPVYQSPMDDNGYDISDYLTIAPEFGTIEDLEELIEETKDRDMKIILDLVVNHTSDEHEWFQQALKDRDSRYHDYYIFKEGQKEPNNWRSIFGGSVWEKVPGRDEYYFHAFGRKQPDLNWENPELRNEIYEMVNWWLDKGIAGFRVDAITFIKKDLSWQDREPDGADGLAKCTKASRNQPGIGEFLLELKERTFDRHQCVTVAEAPGVPYEGLGDFMGENGYFSMIFDFRYADLDIASGSEWFKRIDWKIRDLNDKIMASQMALQTHGWGANFIENHDQPRAATKYLKEAQDNPNAVKTLAAMYFFLRGVPFIYQGQELGMKNFERNSIEEFNDLSSIDQYYRSMEEGYSREEALEIVNLRSRDNARTPFPWNEEQYGGFSSVKPWLGMTKEYPEINAEFQIGKIESMYEFYKNMIRFRQKGPHRDCFIYGKIEPLSGSSEVIAYKRYTENETICCWFNFSDREIEEVFPAGYEVVEPVWQNYGESVLDRGQLKLQPYQSVFLKMEQSK
ncbi:alpha-glucosidase [Clostridium sp. AM58-1XD]|uniref:glycoside hydrolase family 13 protein n=1 Tax=Clostridium sp. AM58-1XD TaxID=2292307 RepID=UPI000E4A7815|nr:alpha-glucosidase [Clostridium sp. AM58-1XD]RGY95996.1 alpha-glucosidase [Clostridium sp. AM58-1XD]